MHNNFYDMVWQPHSVSYAAMVDVVFVAVVATNFYFVIIIIFKYDGSM